MTFKNNQTNNPLVTDRFRYDVLYHSDLSRDSGSTNGLDLSRIIWSNYDLVVIDESHNFRNGGTATGEDFSADEFDDDIDRKENRYQRLLNQVIRKGVKTKVLMLSATPVNIRFNDLKNQLRLAYEDDSEKMDSLLTLVISVMIPRSRERLVLKALLNMILVKATISSQKPLIHASCSGVSYSSRKISTFFP